MKTMIGKIRLQAVFILLKIFNVLYSLSFPFFLRGFLLKITGIKAGKGAVVHSVLFFSFGRMTIGDNTVINRGCYLDNRRGIFIGSNVVVAHDAKIYTLGHDYNDPAFAAKGAPVRIEDYAIIFANALIMPGVTIGRGAVVLPGSVVTKNVENMTVVGGNPAKPVKKREKLHTEKPPFRYWFS